MTALGIRGIPSILSMPRCRGILSLMGVMSMMSMMSATGTTNIMCLKQMVINTSIVPGISVGRVMQSVHLTHFIRTMGTRGIKSIGSIRGIRNSWARGVYGV